MSIQDRIWLFRKDWNCCFGAIARRFTRTFSAFFRPLEAEFASTQSSRDEPLTGRNDAGPQSECRAKLALMPPVTPGGHTPKANFALIRCRALWLDWRRS